MVRKIPCYKTYIPGAISAFEIILAIDGSAFTGNSAFDNGGMEKCIYYINTIVTAGMGACLPS